jgi:hypothetical protein
MGRLTEARRRWLTKLRDEGPAKRERGRTGYDCMVVGWTDWLVRTKDGELIQLGEAMRRWPDPGERLANTTFLNEGEPSEVITEAGRRALKESEDG